MNGSSCSSLLMDGALMEPSGFTPGGDGTGISIGTLSPSPSPAPSMFNFNVGNTPPHDPPSSTSLFDRFSPGAPPHQHTAEAQSKESVCVTVRFRPLSSREIQKGDEVAWYADGDTTVRSEYNPNTAYAFDRVFGPATTTRGVYDVAAQNVVRGAMEGINGTVFAYGVTSSGKTYTMHGDPKSPGIIPLAVKDIFSTIQETPEREYLLRVSYLEIYNEVINDLLDPAGQNLRIREDAQGIYVEDIKEEVILSPVHALSLIAAGEELRHVGSNNYNLVSSRSHTVFTLTIESSPRPSDPYDDVEEITVSQLNLIDLAGSESSKTETTGQRRKEGSYINKSLLTLGTVIGKLSKGRASHVPYRDSKLTRLLQSSLCGYGRVSLICTLTPASSNMEETQHTLKFAHRAKRVTVQATANRTIDERSLIKKYQKEILSLKEELGQLKREKLFQNVTPCEGSMCRHEQNYEDFDTGISPIGLSAPAQLDVNKRLMAGQEALDLENGDQTSIKGQCWPHLALKRKSMTEQVDLLRARLNMEISEVANHVNTLRLLSEQASSNLDDQHLQVEMNQTKSVIKEKEMQLQALEQQMMETVLEVMENASPSEMSEIVSNLICQLNRKEREFEVKAVDSKFLQEELQAKLLEIKRLQTALTIEQHQRHDMLLEGSVIHKTHDTQLSNTRLKRSAPSSTSLLKGGGLSNRSFLNGDYKARGAEADCSDSESLSSKGSSHFVSQGSSMQSQMLMQAAKIDSLQQEMVCLQEENGGLQVQSQKLAEEASYAKELASAAAVELRNLADEVTKLSFQNSKLTNDLSTAQNDFSLLKQHGHYSTDDFYRSRTGSMYKTNAELDFREDNTDSDVDDIESWKLDPEDFKRELHVRKERERCLESNLADKEQVETDLRKKLEEGKEREASLENDLAGMWVQLAMLKREKGRTDLLDSDEASIENCESFVRTDAQDNPSLGAHHQKEQCINVNPQSRLEEVKQRTAYFQTLVSQLKASRQDKEKKHDSKSHFTRQDDERSSHACKICFEAPTAAVLLPCRHFCLCKACAVVCTECPLCRSGIADRIIAFTS